MVDPQAVLAEHVQAAMGSAFGPEHAHRDPVIRPSSHADFQANAALALAKVVGLPPREVAAPHRGAPASVATSAATSRSAARASST